MTGPFFRAVVFALTLALVLVGGSSGANQSSRGQAKFEIRFLSRSFTPQPGADIAAIKRLRDGAATDEVHFLAQFSQLPTAAKHKAIEDAGVHLLTYATGNTYIASTSVANLERLDDLAVRWAGPLEPNDKLEPALAAGKVPAWARTKDGRTVLTVQVHADVPITEAEALVRAFGGRVVGSLPSLPAVVASFAPGRARAIAGADRVQYVSPIDPPLEPANDGARTAANVTPLAAAPYNLTGNGVNVLVYDVGQIDPAHGDFTGRLLSNDGSAVADHASHVGGTVAGDGSQSNQNDTAGNNNGGTANQWAGMAPGAGIRSFGTTGNAASFYSGAGLDLNADFTTAIGQGIDIATMSLGNNVLRFNPAPCAQLGDYSTVSVLIDNIVNASISGQRLIYFESAGNERGQGATGPAPCGQFSTISSPAPAKNSIVVGAINSNDNSLTGFTSLGPTDDGRTKPDLVAPGCQSTGDGGLTSTSFIDLDPAGPAGPNGTLDAGETQNTYVVKCGTSMATPVVAGAGALLVQQWRATFGAATRPFPRTVKAIMVHTATDLGNAGPDFSNGWGALNAQAAVDVVRNDIGINIVDPGIAQGDTDFFTFNSDGTSNVKVTLAWDDPTAAALAATTLVNNLDLRLTGPDGTVYQPFLLDPTNPGNAATTGDDNRNNVEQVVAPAQAGTWTVSVNGETIPAGSEDYALITPVDAAFNNRPPVADVADVSTPEGANVTVTAAGSTDPDSDALTYAWDLDNDGAFDDATGVTATFDQVGQDGAFTVRVKATDPDGAFDTDSATVTVTNVAPTVGSLSSDGPKPEGTPVTVTGTVSDPGWLEGLSATINWGDGSLTEPITGGTLENVRPNATLTFSVSHTYLDDDADDLYTATICGSDDDTTACAPLVIGIFNVPPTVGPITVPGGAIQINTPVNVSGSFTDPGVLDTHTAVWDWADGTTSPGTVTQGAGSGSVTDSHSYTSADLYAITLTVTDDDGGVGASTSDFVPVFDPARSLAVNAKIDSPPGAYVPNGAKVGFAYSTSAARYKSGMLVPSGSATFQFSAVPFYFSAGNLEWLVVANGGRGYLKGTGSVNSVPGYSFLLSVVDAQIAGAPAATDKYRLKVWNTATNAVVYDSQFGAPINAPANITLLAGSVQLFY